MDRIKDVLLVAGTHGNELSGIYLQKLIKEGLYDADRTTFATSSLIANPEAVKRNVRYIDCDLNRQFAIANMDSESHEAGLARKLISKYGGEQTPFFIDLHNTNSNMGATLILLAGELFYQKMGAYIKQRMPNANILFEDRKEWHQQPYLCTLGQQGIMIEVGAQAHGSLKFDTLELMKQMLTLVLDYLEKHNLNRVGAVANYDAYYYTEEVKIPLDDDGMRLATVHPVVCGNDFEVVKPGEPLLVTFSGDNILWESAHDIYPHFINESAYSKDNIAMALAEKKQVITD